MHVARAESGKPLVADTAEVAAPRGGLLRRLRRALGYLPFFRAFVAIEVDAARARGGDRRRDRAATWPARRALLVIAARPVAADHRGRAPGRDPHLGAGCDEPVNPSVGCVVLTAGPPAGRPASRRSTRCCARATWRLDVVVVGNGCDPSGRAATACSVVALEADDWHSRRAQRRRAGTSRASCCSSSTTTRSSPRTTRWHAWQQRSRPTRSSALVQLRVEPRERRTPRSRDWVPAPAASAIRRRSSDMTAVWEGAVAIRREVFERGRRLAGASSASSTRASTSAGACMDAGWRMRYAGDIVVLHPSPAGDAARVLVLFRRAQPCVARAPPPAAAARHPLRDLLRAAHRAPAEVQAGRCRRRRAATVTGCAARGGPDAAGSRRLRTLVRRMTRAGRTAHHARDQPLTAPPATATASPPARTIRRASTTSTSRTSSACRRSARTCARLWRRREFAFELSRTQAARAALQHGLRAALAGPQPAAPGGRLLRAGRHPARRRRAARSSSRTWSPGIFAYHLVSDAVREGAKSVVTGGPADPQHGLPARAAAARRRWSARSSASCPRCIVYMPVHVARGPAGRPRAAVGVPDRRAAGRARLGAGDDRRRRSRSTSATSRTSCRTLLRIWLYASPVLYYARRDARAVPVAARRQPARPAARRRGATCSTPGMRPPPATCCSARAWAFGAVRRRLPLLRLPGA